MSFLKRVKDALGYRLTHMYGSPAYWNRPYERTQLFGSTDKVPYDDCFLARCYPEMEFDTSYYTRVGRRPLQLHEEDPEEDALIPDRPNSFTNVPSHIPKPFYMLEKNAHILQQQQEDLAKYGLCVYGAVMTDGTWPVHGFDSDFLYFHD